MGIIIRSATKGTSADNVSEIFSGLGNPRLNTAFIRVSNQMSDHPMTLKQARIVNTGRLLTPPSLTIEPEAMDLFAVQSESKSTGYCGQFLHGIGAEIDGKFYEDAVECMFVVLLQDSREHSFQYILGINGRNVFKPRSSDMIKHWRTKRGWFRGWEDQWKLGDGDLADQNIVKWTVDSELSVRQGDIRVGMTPKIADNTATCTVVLEQQEAP